MFHLSTTDRMASLNFYFSNNMIGVPPLGSQFSGDARCVGFIIGHLLQTKC